MTTPANVARPWDVTCVLTSYDVGHRSLFLSRTMPVRMTSPAVRDSSLRHDATWDTGVLSVTYNAS